MSRSSQRAVFDRRRSDTDKDRREASYYGPSFQKPAGKRSSSLAGYDIKHPQMPDPFVKRPNPYPPPVEREYNEYKARGDEYFKANQTAKAASAAANTRRSDALFREKVERAAQAAADARLTAEKVIHHHKEAYTHKQAGASWRKREQKLRKKL